MGARTAGKSDIPGEGGKIGQKRKREWGSLAEAKGSKKEMRKREHGRSQRSSWEKRKINHSGKRE